MSQYYTLQWQTCTEDCYAMARPVLRKLRVTAMDILSGNELVGASFSIYKEYPSNFIGCANVGTCGTLVHQGTLDVPAMVVADAYYLVVVAKNGYNSAYSIVYKGLTETNFVSSMVANLLPGQDRFVLKWDSMMDLDLWVDIYFGPSVRFKDRYNSTNW